MLRDGGTRTASPPLPDSVRVTTYPFEQVWVPTVLPGSCRPAGRPTYTCRRERERRLE